MVVRFMGQRKPHVLNPCQCRSNSQVFRVKRAPLYSENFVRASSLKGLFASVQPFLLRSAYIDDSHDYNDIEP